MDRLELDPAAGKYTGAFDPAVDSPSSIVIHCAAALTGRDPIDMEPLYTVLDPDHLDELLSSDHTSVEVQTEFTYEGFVMAVTNVGSITIRAADDARKSR
ncbi:HalOD1 output domain-containing protein [Halobaculum marinum]|uniref:HalOD1 output domain-containing protein n=1 Tax=Halobaculum marinum TaxID=3031996 RepID=A0ABD5WUC0_9EURY|nr:HalOD1 output domain-containing protein [Halobaculum sp. DT55]